MSKWGKFFAIVQTVGLPVLIAVNPALAPIALPILKGVQEAAQLAGKSGAEKLAHVVNIAADAADAANLAAGHVVVDPALVQQTAAHAISTTYDAVKLVHDAHVTAPGA